MKRALKPALGRSVLAATAAALVLTACGDGVGSARLVHRAAPAGPLTLADVAAACSTPTDGGPGIAVIDRELRDANTTQVLPDCVLHLEQGADVWLNNVRITGGVLNIHDRATDASVNRVELQRVTIESVALLVELNDADDVLDAQATTITTARGIGVRVAGTRNNTNAGGSVTFVGSTLLSTDKEATIHVLASEHSGKVRLVSTTVDTRGPLTVLAHDCEALLDGRKLDCSTAAAEADLG